MKQAVFVLFSREKSLVLSSLPKTSPCCLTKPFDQPTSQPLPLSAASVHGCCPCRRAALPVTRHKTMRILTKKRKRKKQPYGVHAESGVQLGPHRSYQPGSGSKEVCTCGPAVPLHTTPCLMNRYRVGWLLAQREDHQTVSLRRPPEVQNHTHNPDPENRHSIYNESSLGFNTSKLSTCEAMQDRSGHQFRFTAVTRSPQGRGSVKDMKQSHMSNFLLQAKKDNQRFQSLSSGFVLESPKVLPTYNSQPCRNLYVFPGKYPAGYTCS